MKIKILITKHVLFAAFIMICSQLEVYSQETVIKKVKKLGWYIGASGGLTQTHIINEGTLSVANLQSKEMSSYVGSAEFGCFFTRHFGLSTGFDYATYKTQVNFNSYENKFNTIDSEDEPYERRVTGTDIMEVQDIAFISVPIYLNLRLPFSKSFGFYLQAGANISVPISNSYSSSGTFTYKGYYSTYNVLLENLPDYGFPSNHNTVAKGEFELEQYNINAIGSAGFDLFIQKKIQIAIGAFYSKSLTNISAYSEPDKFQLSSDVDQMNSLMGGCSKVSLESMGIKIGLRYYFKSHK